MQSLVLSVSVGRSGDSNVTLEDPVILTFKKKFYLNEEEENKNVSTQCKFWKFGSGKPCLCNTL